MPKLMISLLAAAGIAFAGAAGAADNKTMSRDAYKADKDKIEAQYKVDKDRCGSMSGNAKDVCIKEAKGAEKKAKANAEAQYKNTEKARQDAAITAAHADYDVAKEKCDDKKGTDKDVCIKEAKAAETKAVSDAKATQKVAAVRQDARDDKMDADYKVAIEKCDAMSGAAKDSCVSAAKAKFKK